MAENIQPESTSINQESYVMSPTQREEYLNSLVQKGDIGENFVRDESQAHAMASAEDPYRTRLGNLSEEMKENNPDKVGRVESFIDRVGDKAGDEYLAQDDQTRVDVIQKSSDKLIPYYERRTETIRETVEKIQQSAKRLEELKSQLVEKGDNVKKLSLEIQETQTKDPNKARELRVKFDQEISELDPIDKEFREKSVEIASLAQSLV